MKKLLVLLVFLLIIGALIVMLPGYLSVSSFDEPVDIVVVNGSTLNHVAELLYEEGVIKSRLWFKYRAKSANVDRSIKPGNYTLSPNITISEIFDLLKKGTPEKPIILTIPEGYTIYQIAEKVEALNLATAEDFIKASEKYYDEHLDYSAENLYFKLEGYLYPETYHFSNKSTPEDIVYRLAKTMKNVLTEEYLQRASELDLTIHEVLTIASIIEREAFHDEERSKISGVIHNRLRINMPLQVDATVIYGLGEGMEHINRVYNTHLETPNPFNTYTNLGIPPGPIGAPGKASIHATLYPEVHDYFYYVLGENGHVFGKTYQEHLRNVESYRKILNRQ
ncbi:endolytic transglycosylase MltG [Alkaliphilus pronyensis]|uniref:Endolytic murein transglycosylase n=1 Tax=Alkaliphilus pronyensis TaxID=1482732 RepID=A0A6I0FHE8_9FIRM|nr:endolytic transglycosylase MltG [Alkaliphilus pronyensis]KAB3537828.1 endolytic transglycosylase MltG [Alkaliphilus pronyensis]